MRIVAVLIGLVLVALLLWRWIMPRETQPPAPTSPDGQVIAQLVAAGSDLSKSHKVDFYIYLPTQEAAISAKSSLENRGFEITVQPAAQGSDWLVHLRREMLLSESELASLRSEFSTLAGRLGGEYDGWGAEVVAP